MVGGGIAGLSLAWELARRGRHVSVLDAGPIGGAASLAATSYMEPRFGRGASRRLEWAALARWPDYAAQLTEASGMSVPLRHGQWRFAFAADESAVRADMERRRGLGWRVSWLSGEALREQVPELAREVVGACAVADPLWTDGAQVCKALRTALERKGHDVRENMQVDRVTTVHVNARPHHRHGLACLARTRNDGEPRSPPEHAAEIDGANVVLCAGSGVDRIAWAGAGPLRGEEVSALGVPPVRRLKGTALLYRTRLALPHMLRHPDISIVPRANGVLVGASKEPDATSLAPDPDVVAHLHQRACRVLPALADVCPEPRTGWRAYVDGTALALGRSGDVPRLWWSLGHGGVGYLRAPVIAAEMAGAMCGEPLDLCGPFFTGPHDALEKAAAKG